MKKVEILKVITDSRLHGLNTKSSDTDTVTVVVSDPLSFLSIQKRSTSPVQTLRDNIDDTSYELNDFVRLAVKGNPNLIESLFSDLVVSSTVYGDELQGMWSMIVSQAAYKTYNSFATSEIIYLRKNFDKKRVRNAARILQQGTRLLKTGCLFPPLTEDEVEVCKKAESLNRVNMLKYLDSLQTQLAEAVVSSPIPQKPNIAAIEKWMEHTYWDIWSANRD